MKLLIVTQVVDRTNPDLGFFHRWLQEFAKHCEFVEVICLYKGEFELPENVRVHSLGKELRGEGGIETHDILKRAAYAARFLHLSYSLRKNYDAVFVHMNPEYVVLSGIQWHLWNKRIGLWYLHRSVDLKLRIAASLAEVIFSASKESFRLPSKKLHIVGHGIDTTQFVCEEKTRTETHMRMVTVGRISRSKYIHTLLDAVKVLGTRGMAISFETIGASSRAEDTAYEHELVAQAQELPQGTRWTPLGAKQHDEIATLLCGYDMFLHASTGTGSIDKAVLEALLANVPVVSTSEAFRDLLAPHGLFVESGTADGIADAVQAYFAKSEDERKRICTILRADVVQNYSLEALIPRILGILAV